MINKYLQSLIDNAESTKQSVTVPGWGKDGKDMKWTVKPLDGNDELFVASYINRTAPLTDINDTKIGESIHRIAKSLMIEDDEERNGLILQAANIVWMGLQNGDAKDIAHAAAVIYLSAFNQVGQPIFKSVEAKTQEDEFKTVDALLDLPKKMLDAAMIAIRKSALDPTVTGIQDGDGDANQEELEKK